MFIQNLKVFLHSKKLLLLSIIGLLLIVLLEVRTLTFYGNFQKEEINGVSEASITYAFLFFVIIFAVSYEYMRMETMNHMSECIMVNKTAYLISRFTKYGILFLLAILYTGISYLPVILFKFLIGHVPNDYMLHNFKEHLIYFLCPLLIGVLFGAAFSYIKRSFVGIFAGVFSVIAFGIVHYKIDEMVMGSFQDFIHIFCVTTSFPDNYAIFQSTSIHMVSKVCIWLSILFAVNVILSLPGKLKLFSTVFLPVFMVSAMAFQKPVSGYFPGYVYKDYARHDVCPDAQYEKFHILGYDMDLTIGEELDAKVTVNVDKKSLPYYEFTLFYNYQVQSVIDNLGNKLKFYRNQNKLIVETLEDSDSFTIQYHGQGALKYYSCKDGVYLQGNFPYYPMAGEKELQDIGLCELPQDEMNFNVRVTACNEIYSNLKEAGKENKTSNTKNNVSRGKVTI